jgi:ElaB/YqjD/DUF883 family membrane-anchored ribosome-binding protein
MENEEVIRRQMETTREALNDKLETLEQRVADSVLAVTDTVASVKEKVQEGVESVKDAVDVPAHVDHHPWLMLGGSVLCGFVLGNLLMNRKHSAPALYAPLPPKTPEPANGNGRRLLERQEAPAPSANWLSAFEPEIKHLKGLALGVTLGTVREMLTEQAPPHMAEQIREIIDAVTRKAGGEPVPSSDWAATQPATSPETGPECSGANAQNSRW